MHLWPKRLIRCQKLRLPQLSHFRAPPCQSIPLPNLGTRHPSSQKLMCWMSSAGSFLKKSAFQSRNYWLWLQRSGGISRKQPPQRGYQLCQWRHNPKWPITLPLSQLTSTMNIFRLNQHCHFGRLRLLWITRLQSWASSTVAAKFIHQDIWERLGMPMKHKQVMLMELANGQSNATMGSIPSICFSIGEVSLYCQVQVVKEAPFECLLGLPFTCLASTKCQEFPDGSAHLLLTDPNTGASITILTHAKQSCGDNPPPCDHEGDF